MSATEAVSLLTRAEREIFDALLRGESVPQIARARGRSACTVANQARDVRLRFGVRSQLALLALFVVPPPAAEESV